MQVWGGFVVIVVWVGLVAGFWFSWMFCLCLAVGFFCFFFLTPLCATASVRRSALALRMIAVDILG